MPRDPEKEPARTWLQRQLATDGAYRLRKRDTTGMRFPVRCTHCNDVYDLGKVTVTARYADCSVWTSPCCRRPGCDDRPGWGGRLGDIEKLY